MKICKYLPKMSEQKIYSIENINNHKNGDNLYAKNLIPIISFPLYSTVVVYDEQHGEEEENRIISVIEIDNGRDVYMFANIVISTHYPFLHTLSIFRQTHIALSIC